MSHYSEQPDSAVMSGEDSMAPVTGKAQRQRSAENGPDFHRFATAVQRSYQTLENYRELNRKLVAAYAGTHYNDSSNDPNRYVNLIQQAVEAYQMNLAASRPRVMVSSYILRYRAFARFFEHAMNQLIGEIGLEETLSQWVQDAFFCVGIVKTHLANAGMIEIEADRWMDPGRPFASNIALDDFVYDVKANKWSEVRYAGDMYSLSYENALEVFGDKIKPFNPRARATDDADRVDTMSRGTDTDRDEYQDMIDLADIWLPEEGVIKTFVVHSRRQFQIHYGEPIAVEEWTGNEHGPYHLLGLGDVSENIMPSSPASNLQMLDTLVNDMWRKASKQARRQKTVTTYTNAGAGAAKKVRLADDGDMINVTDPSDVNVMQFGGVDAGSYSFLIGAQESFDRMAGNLSAMAGLGAQTGTVGQDQMINNAVSSKMDTMRNKVVAATNRLIKALGVMLWQDEFMEMSLQIPIEGTDIVPSDMWRPGDREGKFLDYNFEVDVFSMAYQSPGKKLEAINSVVQNVFIPMMPFLQQQGGAIDMFELAKTYSKLMNLPELNHIIQFQGIPASDMMSQKPVAEIPRKAPTSTRNYVRTNVSAADRNPMGESAKMMNQAAMAGAQTPGGMT